MSAPILRWGGPPPAEVQAALARLARLDDVVQIAVMPDVHLSREVCIGTVIATEGLLYPAAVGGDIGRGVSAMRVNLDADVVTGEDASGAVLAGLRGLVPGLKHHNPPPLPEHLLRSPLSCARLEKHKHREGRAQLGTLGRGNHFLELQADLSNPLWAMVHTGSRSMGPAIQAHHRALASHRSGGLEAILASSDEGGRYQSDVRWARRYAQHSRQRILAAVAALLQSLFGAEPDTESYLDCDHNHACAEEHGGRQLWVHRKGAIPAHSGQPGFIPGSMGTASYRVEGRGCAAALCSSSHGAGRKLSRTEARRQISPAALKRQVRSVRLDESRLKRFVEEAPGAYKDIDAVMRAQSELTRIQMKLRPVLNYRV